MSFFSIGGFVFPAVLSWACYWRDLAGDGPDKAGEFAGHGGDGHLGLLPAHTRQMGVAVMQSPLGFPGNVGDGFGQTFLPLFQVRTQARRYPILPRRFHQGAAGRSVAHLGDAALLAIITRGVFAGHQSEITHQLAGMLKAVEVTQFGHQRGGMEQGHAPQTHQRPHRRCPTPAWHRAFNLPVIALQSRGRFANHVEHLLEDDLLRGKGHLDFGQIPQVRQ